MSESQKCQNFPVVAVRGGGGGDGGGACTSNTYLACTKHASWSLIWSNLKTDLISVIQHDIYSDFSLL